MGLVLYVLVTHHTALVNQGAYCKDSKMVVAMLEGQVVKLATVSTCELKANLLCIDYIIVLITLCVNEPGHTLYIERNIS